jgi:hypothetical protein
MSEPGCGCQPVIHQMLQCLRPLTVEWRHAEEPQLGHGRTGQSLPLPPYMHSSLHAAMYAATPNGTAAVLTTKSPTSSFLLLLLLLLPCEPHAHAGCA